MKRRFFLPLFVLFYVYSTYVDAATTCNEFRADLQAIQQQVRQIESNRSTSVLNAVQQAGQLIKSGCLDQLSAVDMSAFGFTPGASALVTKLANQACQKLSQQLSQKISEVQQQAVQGVNGTINGVNIPGVSTSSISGALGGLQPSMTTGSQPSMNSQPSVTSQATSYVANAWDKLKNMIMP
ncbi:hypothetical protein [Massilia orientalis]|uniref:Uncharacterized protein n=1 Tax=Massilia orientalis TaxID=3050128 RepID=A0ACC7MIM1_9BURK|nr:hypothetical protein [Massilia sp. YIM B02787]